MHYLEVQAVKNAGVIGGFMSDLQDVVDVLFLHFTDSTAGFFVCVLFVGFAPPIFFS